MSHTTDTVDGAIDRSISHNEIVTVRCADIDVAFGELLDAVADDTYDYVATHDADGERMLEVWSTSGEEWRVHLSAARGGQ